ncbi:predicted protein [Sclerotinia sclerotiorum 1980 UF-70]|uniref:Uncharacterized protein n=1 Tax=Sclerotinia sclerotiorum (strain ATCC 18683 / 1980 / Ss-1) TaxID=665079 RepID=A7F124_SCLS1|nr:predicted protein [Sclerotinia sclerotiorum 1980 UF-70]EDN95416.1 predicted protein [Sclerotinia sclerotiorum 1980 UF-70]
MAEGRRIISPIMPTTSLAHIAPGPPDPLGGKKSNRITRVSTSDGSSITEMLDGKGKRFKIDVENPSYYAATPKAPPRPPIARPDPDKLESKKRTEMERRQFAPLTADWFVRIVEQVYRVDEERWGKWAVDLDKMKLLRSDFRFLMKILDTDPTNDNDDDQELAHVPMTIVDLYIYLVCEYRNRAIARTLEGGDLAGNNPTKQKISCILIDSQILYWDPKRGRYVDRVDDEGNVTRMFLHQNLPLAWAKAEEALARYDDETLHNLDYLLIPYEYKGAHTVLIGIAPKQKFCFHIDNSGTMVPRYLERDWKVEVAHHHTFHMNLLEAIVYSRFHKGVFDTVELPLYGQWEYRTDHRAEASRTTDNSPNVSRQQDAHNCGKRPRVAAEFLNGGFNKPFDYPMFKIPTKLQEIAIDPSYKHNLRPDPPPFVSGGIEDPDEKETEEMGDEDDDEDEVGGEGGGEGEGEDGAESSQAGARTKVKKTNTDKKVKWSGQNALDPDPFDPNPPEPGSTADERPKTHGSRIRDVIVELSARWQP